MTATPLRERFDKAEPFTGPQPAPPTTIRATPFVWRDPKDIPRRPWVYGRWLLRNTVTAVVAPGGVGKSSLMATTILALATGRALLGKTVWEGPKRVWYWNLEDDGDELSRQVQAAARHHVIKPEDCTDRLFVDSGLDGATLCLAVEDRAGYRILHPVVEALTAELIDRGIDVLLVDPFVSSDAVSENDNGAIDAVAKEWSKVAKRAGCSIVLVHHTKKLSGAKVTSEASRGAIALIAAARSALVLNRMDTDEAKHFGIGDDEERRRIFAVQDDKSNRAPAEKADWYRIASVDLGNGGSEDGDNVGVVTPWTPPDLFEGMASDALLRVQHAVEQGRWRENHQSPQWVGVAVADVLGLDFATHRKRIHQMVKVWIGNDALRVVEGQDERRKPVKFVERGQWVNDHAPPTRVERSKVEQSRAEACSTTTPYGVWGGAEQSRGNQTAVEQPGRWNGNPALGHIDEENANPAADEIFSDRRPRF